MQEKLIFPLFDTLNKQLNDARANRYSAAAKKKELTNRVKAFCESRPIQKFPDKVWIDVTWQLKSFANDPLDNLPAALKSILDGMVKAKVIKKDSLMIIQSPVVHHYDRGENKVVILISDEPIWILQRVEELATV